MPHCSEMLSATVGGLHGDRGMDRATISRLENSQIDNPAIATMTRYAKALGKKLLVSLVEAGRE